MKMKIIATQVIASGIMYALIGAYVIIGTVKSVGIEKTLGMVLII